MATYESLQLQEVVSTLGNKVWDFLELKDVLALSETSKVTESLVLPVENLNSVQWNSISVRFPHELTVGMYRRVMHNLHHIREATVQIDERNGRVMLDIGSAIHDDSDEEEEFDPEQQTIFKHLEHFSCDEYDDFNPRHPQPKDRAHRRGDSYFNSDIDMVVGELSQPVKPIDLSSIAQAAKQSAGGDAGSEGGAKSLKDRILAKKGGAVAGKGKSNRAVSALNEGSDEEK